MSLPSGPHLRTAQDCRICQTLPPEKVVALDELMGDPRRWSIATAYGAMVPTAMTPAARKFGATNVGVTWLREQGYIELDRRMVLSHYTRHTPIVATTLEEYAAFAAVGDARTPRAGRDGGMLATGQVYDKGIDLANMSLAILRARLEDRLRTDPSSVSSAELMAYAEYGQKLAISAATLKRGGASPFGRDKDTYAGFRGGPDAPSPRMGHHRVRVVDGEARPVTDEGPKDRDEYNARALAEGREGL